MTTKPKRLEKPPISVTDGARKTVYFMVGLTKADARQIASFISARALFKSGEPVTPCLRKLWISCAEILGGGK